MLESTIASSSTVAGFFDFDSLDNLAVIDKNSGQAEPKASTSPSTHPPTVSSNILQPNRRHQYAQRRLAQDKHILRWGLPPVRH